MNIELVNQFKAFQFLSQIILVLFLSNHQNLTPGLPTVFFYDLFVHAAPSEV